MAVPIMKQVNDCLILEVMIKTLKAFQSKKVSARDESLINKKFSDLKSDSHVPQDFSKLNISLILFEKKYKHLFAWCFKIK